MVNSVSSVPFTQARAMDKMTPEMIQTPGLYSAPGVAGVPTEQTSKKKGGFFSFVGKAILWAAVIGGSLLAAKKWIPQIRDAKAIKNLAPDAKLMEKVCSRTKQAADWVDGNVVKKVATFINSKGKVKENEQLEIFDLIG